MTYSHMAVALQWTCHEQPSLDRWTTESCSAAYLGYPSGFTSLDSTTYQSSPKLLAHHYRHQSSQVLLRARLLITFLDSLDNDISTLISCRFGYQVRAMNCLNIDPNASSLPINVHRLFTGRFLPILKIILKRDKVQWKFAIFPRLYISNSRPRSSFPLFISQSCVAQVRIMDSPSGHPVSLSFNSASGELNDQVADSESFAQQASNNTLQDACFNYRGFFDAREYDECEVEGHSLIPKIEYLARIRGTTLEIPAVPWSILKYDHFDNVYEATQFIKVATYADPQTRLQTMYVLDGDYLQPLLLYERLIISPYSSTKKDDQNILDSR
jgi:hypothetical protein